MYRTACRALLLILAGVTIINSTPISTLDLLRLLNDKSWVSDHRVVWEKYPGASGLPETKDDDYRNYVGDIVRLGTKRSAVATALNAGRRRRQPSPALGKAATPYLGVGVLNDMGIFFDALRDNLEVLASLSPHERSTLLHNTPTVVQAPTAGNADMSSGGGGGGSGMRRLHALRPLRPASNIRSYNRRSLIEPDGGYPGANHHDPGLLWTGLGR